MGVDQDFFICLTLDSKTLAYYQLSLSALKVPRYQSIRHKSHSIHSKPPKLLWWGFIDLNGKNLLLWWVSRNQNSCHKAVLRVSVNTWKSLSKRVQIQSEWTHFYLLLGGNWERFPHCLALWNAGHFKNGVMNWLHENRSGSHTF